MKHCDGVGLVARTGHKETLQLNLRLVLPSGDLRTLEALCPPLRGEKGDEIAKLLGHQGEQLIAGLSGLQGARGPLARRHERSHLRLRCVQVAHDRRLRLQRVLEAGQRILPPVLRVGDELAGRGRAGVAARYSRWNWLWMLPTS